MWVKDIDTGFHNVSIHEDDIYRLCIRFDGDIFAFQRLPMGLTSSPNIFTEFMHFPLWAIANNDNLVDEPWEDDSLYYLTVDSRIVDTNNFRKASDLSRISDTPYFRMALIDSYVDDIFGLHLNPTKNWQQWNHSETVFRKMNLKCKEAKGRPPNQINILLGKEYDLKRQWVRLGDEKFNRYKTFLISIISMEWISELTLLKAIGRARHAATIYKALSAFARGLETFIPYQNRPRYRGKLVKLGLGPDIKNSPALRERIRCLLRCMTIANKIGVPFKYFRKTRQDKPDFRIITDASMLIGAGGIASDGTYFQTRWTDITLHIEKQTERDIQWRELVAIYGSVLAMEARLGHSIEDSLIEIFTDNEACKYMLINMTAKLGRPDLQTLINNICEFCIRRRVHLWMEHIPGSENLIADALSRFYTDPLNFTQLKKHHVGQLTSDQSKQVTRWIQHGADAAHRSLSQTGFKIKQQYQEFPPDFDVSG